MDDAEVMMGMPEFFHALAKSRRDGWRWPDGADAVWPSPYTNLMWIDLAWARSDAVRAVLRAVNDTGCIWTNRWGDLPLW